MELPKVPLKCESKLKVRSNEAREKNDLIVAESVDSGEECKCSTGVLLIDDDFFRLISLNISFVNILGQKCKIANVLHLAMSELQSNYSKTCCSNFLKLIIVNMAIKDFNPCLILQEI